MSTWSLRDLYSNFILWDMPLRSNIVRREVGWMVQDKWRLFCLGLLLISTRREKWWPKNGMGLLSIPSFHGKYTSSDKQTTQMGSAIGSIVLNVRFFLNNETSVEDCLKDFCADLLVYAEDNGKRDNVLSENVSAARPTSQYIDKDALLKKASSSTGYRF